MIKWLWWRYQRAMWLFAIAVGEIKKPLILLQETTLIAILAKLLGIQFGFGLLIIAYVLVSVVFVFIGAALVKSGVQKLTNTFNNYQNEEFVKILDAVKRIEENQKNG